MPEFILYRGPAHSAAVTFTRGLARRELIKLPCHLARSNANEGVTVWLVAQSLYDLHTVL